MKTSKKLFARVLFGLLLTASGCTNETGESITAADGVEIRFDRQGDGGPALIFVHGWGNNRSVWDAQVVHFSRKYEVVNVDLPGFGESGNNRDSFTIASYGDDIASVIRELDIERAVLIGFSMGGPVVIEAALRAPEQVTGVILVDELHDVETKVPPAAMPGTVSFYMDLVANPNNEVLAGSGFYKKNPEASFEKILAMLQGAPGHGWEESLLAVMDWQNEHCTDSISRVRAPIIAINSDNRPTDVAAFQKYAPSFRAKIVPDTGHLVMWDAFDAFNELLEESIREMEER